MKPRGRGLLALALFLSCGACATYEPMPPLYAQDLGPGGYYQAVPGYYGPNYGPYYGPFYAGPPFLFDFGYWHGGGWWHHGHGHGGVPGAGAGLSSAPNVGGPNRSARHGSGAALNR